MRRSALGHKYAFSFPLIRVWNAAISRHSVEDNKEESLMILDDKRIMMVDLYNQLHDLGICKTRYEYSSYWLNRSKRYYSSVINENRDISIETLMNATARLRLLATECGNSRHALLIEKGIKLNAIRTDMEIRITRCITDNLHGEK